MFIKFEMSYILTFTEIMVNLASIKSIIICSMFLNAGTALYRVEDEHNCAANPECRSHLLFSSEQRQNQYGIWVLHLISTY